ncbi:unnamed protein product [Linum tenue]|uniref:Uncharacterized protein n=2 Tax=Linum tenue TaxID=586396 RepID=A0AAV0PQK3_9ROSI|nr:unnamed protein product [Linum tenue]
MGTATIFEIYPRTHKSPSSSPSLSLSLSCLPTEHRKWNQTMSELGVEDEEWEVDFLEAVNQAEELAKACSSSSSSKSKPSSPPPATVAYLPHPPSQLPSFHYRQPTPSRPAAVNSSISYSPPRELTQRPLNGGSSLPRSSPPSVSPPTDGAKDEEIQRLKKELERCSKQLAVAEHECSELKKERVKKDEQLKYSRSSFDVNSSNARNFCREREGFAGNDAHGVCFKSGDAKVVEDRHRDRLTSSSKAVGIQTDIDCDPVRENVGNRASSCSPFPENLLSVWGSTSRQQAGRHLFSKLLTACPAEFRVLFGSMSLSMSAAVLASASSASVVNHIHRFDTFDASRVSDLYNVMIKISNGLLKMEAFFGPLLDLCGVKNVEISRSCLCILHVLLKHLLSFGRESGRRDNVKVEGLHHDNSGKDTTLLSVIQGQKESYDVSNTFGIRNRDPQILSQDGFADSSFASPVACVNWHLLFEMMLQISTEDIEVRVRFEAISIMNLVVMRSNASAEREKFGTKKVLESIARFLKKEAGLSVQKEAVRLLFLLLNCPKLLVSFCSSCNQQSANAAKDVETVSNGNVCSLILSGLAECISCRGNSLQDIELCKRAISTLAFVAASEKSGYEILVGRRLVGGGNFLMLILQELASETNFEGSAVSVEPVEELRARTMLIREALILLNRLVSNPGSSAIVLRVLTGSRDMASLTIEVASRLSSKEHTPIPGYYCSRPTWQPMESEVMELAQKFKRRVFAYLGSMVT